MGKKKRIKKKHPPVGGVGVEDTDPRSRGTRIPQSIWFYLVFFLIGISAAGFMLSGIMIVFEFCTPDIRPTYIGINNTFNGLVAIAMPLIGGWLAKNQGYPIMFGVTFAICLFGLILLRFWVQEPRKYSIS